MPNIHVIGFTRSEYEERLKPLVDRVMQALGLGDDAITTFWPSTDCQAESCDGAHKPKPYISVWSYDIDEIRGIIEALRDANIGVDCEPCWLGAHAAINEIIAVLRAADIPIPIHVDFGIPLELIPDTDMKRDLPF